MGKTRLLTGEELSWFARDQGLPRLMTETDDALRKRLLEHIATNGWKRPTGVPLSAVCSAIQSQGLQEGRPLAEVKRRQSQHIMAALGRANAEDLDDGTDDLRDAMRSRRKEGTWRDEE